jgi:hypothetical protein
MEREPRGRRETPPFLCTCLFMKQTATVVLTCSYTVPPSPFPPTRPPPPPPGTGHNRTDQRRAPQLQARPLPVLEPHEDRLPAGRRGDACGVPRGDEGHLRGRRVLSAENHRRTCRERGGEGREGDPLQSLQ